MYCTPDSVDLAPFNRFQWLQSIECVTWRLEPGCDKVFLHDAAKPREQSKAQT
jgi:hypothetical protein